jgi:hypothetical protein
MVAKTPSTQWYLGNYTKTFDVASRDERTIKADGVYVYANAPLTNTTNICVIYFMSVSLLHRAVVIEWVSIYSGIGLL